MNPSQKIADVFMLAMEQTMLRHGVIFSPELSASCRFTLSALIQEVLDTQAEQSDAQAFGDDLQVTVTGIQKCDCCSDYAAETYGETADLTIKPPNGLN